MEAVVRSLLITSSRCEELQRHVYEEKNTAEEGNTVLRNELLGLFCSLKHGPAIV